MTRKISADGFIPRRSATGAGLSKHTRLSDTPASPHGLKRRTAPDTQQALGHQGVAPSEHGVSRQPTATIRRSDIDESLRDIDAQEAAPKPRRRGGLWSQRKRIVKSLMFIIVVVGVAIGGWLGVKTILASNSIFKGDIFGLIQHKELKKDAKGRSNILVVGTSEDDPGHPGGNLTDSIMVLSIDQQKKDAYMISIPRDLYVKYGMACASGYAGKINVYFSCVDEEDTAAAEDKRQMASRKFFGDIVGLDIQYSAHVNYSVMRDVVNAIGPITVNIEGSGGAPGVMDSNFDWKCMGGNPYASLATKKKNCPPNGHFIDYPNGPAVLDAEHALYLAQARGDTAPTYGLGRSNFDRELNQQKIIVAIKEKATSSGTLTDIGKVTKLIDAIGSNLRTNFATSEIRTLVDLAKDIPSSSIHSVNLIDATPVLFGGDGMGNVVPTAGTYNYTAIQAFIQRSINATGITKENAHVVVLNASGVAGAAQRESDKLTDLGLTIDQFGNAPAGDYTKTVIYQIHKDKQQPLTVAKFKELYGVIPITSAPPVDVLSTTDFVIILVTPTTSVDSSNSTN